MTVDGLDTYFKSSSVLEDKAKDRVWDYNIFFEGDYQIGGQTNAI
jgi:hypothetical protein